MFLIYFLAKPVFWLIPWIITAFVYSRILKKLGYRSFWAAVPLIAERLISKKLYQKKRTFYRPVIIILIVFGFGFYLNPHKGMGKLFMYASMLLYTFYILKLYKNLAAAFGKKRKRLYALLYAVMPLFMLGLVKEEFIQPAFKLLKQYKLPVRILRHIGFAAFSAAEVGAVLALGGWVTLQNHLPRFFVNAMLETTYNATKDVTGGDSYVNRETTMGEYYVSLDEMGTSRDYYFPDHSNDTSVVVMTYITGSNLEDNAGMASANIMQMVDATKKGSGLKFILQTGGCERWFTKEIKSSSYGRYEIADGRITFIEDLPSDTSMVDPDTLSSFISWTSENYEADRYMLVLWDHGGGLYSGFGSDDLNGNDEHLSVSKLVTALDQADMKFDVIGFDACLMQDIEIGKALEPYADYYLASEETEGGSGWFYTSGFGKLAEDPSISSEDFGKEMISCYDPYNIAQTDDGSVNAAMTLSFVDLTRLSYAYDKLEDFFEQAAEVILDSPASFADISIAASNTYTFSDSLQIDLIDFLEILDEEDFDEKICSHEEFSELMNALKASVVYRNKESAEGINGVAIAFPYKQTYLYTGTQEQYSALSLNSEKKMFDEVFSIMVAQRSETDQISDALVQFILNPVSILDSEDFTKESWYIEGFEDYDSTEVLYNIPLEFKETGYQIEVPDRTWDIITDVQTMVYQQTDEVEGAVTRYIGNDYTGDDDENGHAMIGTDDHWVHVGNQLVCYEADRVLITDEGEIYRGKIKARLNGSEDIYLYIEWDPEVEGVDMTAKVLGYMNADEAGDMTDKGLSELQAGDSLQFLFDYYDAEGNFVAEEVSGGTVRVSQQSRLKVADQPLGSCTLEYGGILTDVYQRIMTTEMIEMQID